MSIWPQVSFLRSVWARRGDRDRFLHDDPVVAIVSVGAPRAFLVRPRGGGPSQGWHVGRGDLLVMGGRCQHDWEHCVPKVTGPTGPRLSIMFRHHDANAPGRVGGGVQH